MSNWGKVQYNKQRKHWAVVGEWQGSRVYISQYPSMIGLVTCDSEAMANRLRDTINSDIDKGIFDPKRYKVAKPLHLKKYSETWLENKAPEIADATLHDYKNSLNNHILPVLGDKFLPDINHDDLKNLLNSIKRGPKGKKNVMDCLKNLMQDAMRSGHLSQLPTWPQFKGQNKIVKPPIKAISPNDQLQILANIPLPHRPIFMFMMATGCRPSEARAFRKIDIHPAFLMFVKSFGRGEKLKNVKSEESKPFPMTEEVKEILSEVPKNLTPFVFPNPDTGKPYTKNINRIWNKACTDAGLKPINLYNATRHSFACQMLNGGMDKGQVSKLLRHSDPKMVDRYADYEMETLKSSVDNVRRVNFSVDKKPRNQ
jgi:integrase